MTFQGYYHGHWLLEQELQRNGNQESQQVPVAERLGHLSVVQRSHSQGVGSNPTSACVVSMCH